MARRYSSTHHDADDIAQEATLRAWRHRDRLRDRDRLPGWLARIVHNEAARLHARPVPEPVPEIPESAEVREEAAVIARLDMRAALARLSVEERRLVSLRYLEDLTQPAIAEALGVPEGTVKTRLHRARSKLQRALSEPAGGG